VCFQRRRTDMGPTDKAVSQNSVPNTLHATAVLTLTVAYGARARRHVSTASQYTIADGTVSICRRLTGAQA
jgi:hypothetical protein